MGLLLKVASLKRLGVLLGACIVSLALASPSRAQDPVEKLRQALLLVSPDLEPTPEFLKNRENQLNAAIKEMTALAHYRRAYLLTEWPDDLEPFRTKIVTLFAGALNDAASPKAEPERRLAAALLVVELADADKPDDRKGKGKYTRAFTATVARLAADPDPAVKRAALHALGKITPRPGDKLKPKPDDAIPILKNALAKETDGARYLAAYALTDLAKNAHYLRVSEGDKEKRKRDGPSEELQTIEQAIDAAASRLGDADEKVQGYCLQAIFESARALNDYLDSTIIYPIPQVMDADFKAALDTLNKSNKQILQTLQGPPLKVRLTAVMTLDQIGVVRLKIAKRLRDQAPEKKQTATAMFEAVKAPDPFQNIIKGEWRLIGKLLSEPDVRLRRGAVNLLEQLDEEVAPAEQELARALRDSDRHVRWTAARALRHIPSKDVSKQSVAGLAALLHDDDPDLAVVAATTIQGLGAQVAKQIDMMDPGERTQVLDALANAVAGGPRTAAPNRDVETRAAAMRMLVGIGGAPAKHAIPRLIDALADPEARVRKGAAETLGQFGPAARAALPMLHKALRDDHAEVRQMASEAILSIEKGL